MPGREGDKVQSRVIRDRLMREAETNVAIRVTESAEKDSFEVAGRGELQLGVLIETMRREGFELASAARACCSATARTAARSRTRRSSSTSTTNYAGTVVEKMAQRKGEMTDMRPSGGGKTRLTFSAPSRGLIGYHGEFLSDTRGTGIMNRLFENYGPYKGPIEGRQNGVLISMEQGEAVAYALERARGARHPVRLARREALRGHDHRRECQAAGSRGQSAEVQAAHQLPRLRPQGRMRSASRRRAG